jgi:hypothetical protein
MSGNVLNVRVRRREEYCIQGIFASKNKLDGVAIQQAQKLSVDCIYAWASAKICFAKCKLQICIHEIVDTIYA